MGLSLNDIDQELARRQAAASPSLNEIDAELNRRGASPTTLDNVTSAVSTAAGAAMPELAMAAQVLQNPAVMKPLQTATSLPYRGLRGLATTLTSGINRGAEALKEDFKPQGVKEHLADLAASFGDPRNLAMNPALGDVITGGVVPAAEAVGRTAARGVNIASGVPAEDVRTVANAPIKALFSKTRSAAGKIFQKAKETVGVTPEEERLIAGIGDPSGWKRVADEMYDKAKGGIENLTAGELLAWKKSASMLSRKVTGSGEALYEQDAEKAAKELAKRAEEDPRIAEMVKTQGESGLAIAMSKFASIFPRNKTKGDAVLRGMLQGGAGVAGAMGAGNPIQAALFAPATYYLPTIAAGLAKKGLNVVGNNPAARQTLLAILQQIKG